MSLSKEDNDEKLEFQWGLAGPRCKNPLVRLYKSFTYDGINYEQYDCVYMSKEGSPEPYIGKLVKIWEHKEKFKRVKIQWFFRPSEISYFLKDVIVLKKELFLASGKGLGVVNVNPLDAIGGKCNVVCISKDSRNPRPSIEQLREADYVFYRTFDVDNPSICDKWGEQVGELKVNFIFNRMSDISNNLGILRGVVDDRNTVGCEIIRNLPKMELLDDPKSKAKEKFVSSVDTVTNAEKHLKQSEDSEGRPIKRMKLEVGDNELETNQISSKGKSNVAPKDSLSNPMDVLSKKIKNDKDLVVGKSNITTKLADDSRSFAPLKSSVNLKSSAAEKSKKFIVTRRPNVEKNTWFKDLPSEDRMLNAHEKGTLILLQNLDPEYTSGEVEDIIWHAFREKCSAKMVQHTTISSPHCGQAFVILRSKEVVGRVLKRLREDCLMLPNGRPLVGGLARLPKESEKQASFAGHLSIDKIKQKMQKETREAVSTSHYSQRNTIEYEMAMDWFLLQARTTTWFNKLYKEQEDLMDKLKAKFQSRQSTN